MIIDRNAELTGAAAGLLQSAEVVEDVVARAIGDQPAVAGVQVEHRAGLVDDRSAVAVSGAELQRAGLIDRAGIAPGHPAGQHALGVAAPVRDIDVTVRQQRAGAREHRRPIAIPAKLRTAERHRIGRAGGNRVGADQGGRAAGRGERATQGAAVDLDEAAAQRIDQAAVGHAAIQPQRAVLRLDRAAVRHQVRDQHRGVLRPQQAAVGHRTRQMQVAVVGCDRAAVVQRHTDIIVAASGLLQRALVDHAVAAAKARHQPGSAVVHVDQRAGRVDDRRAVAGDGAELDLVAIIDRPRIHPGRAAGQLGPAIVVDRASAVPGQATGQLQLQIAAPIIDGGNTAAVQGTRTGQRGVTVAVPTEGHTLEIGSLSRACGDAGRAGQGHAATRGLEGPVQGRVVEFQQSVGRLDQAGVDQRRIDAVGAAAILQQGAVVDEAVGAGAVGVDATAAVVDVEQSAGRVDDGGAVAVTRSELDLVTVVDRARVDPGGVAGQHRPAIVVDRAGAVPGDTAGQLELQVAAPVLDKGIA